MTTLPRNVHRERLLLYYTRYNPTKIDTIDAVLGEYRGDEKELFTILLRKYGPDPPDPSQDVYRSRIQRYYKHYFPEKPVDDINILLASNRGREEEMIGEMVQKYGPEPPAEDGAVLPRLGTMTYKTRLQRFFQHYTPHDTEMLANNGKKIEDLLYEYYGREDEMIAGLIEKYGAEPLTEEALLARSQSSRVAHAFETTTLQGMPTMSSPDNSEAGDDENRDSADITHHEVDPVELAPTDRAMKHRNSLNKRKSRVEDEDKFTEVASPPASPPRSHATQQPNSTTSPSEIQTKIQQLNAEISKPVTMPTPYVGDGLDAYPCEKEVWEKLVLLPDPELLFCEGPPPETHFCQTCSRCIRSAHKALWSPISFRGKMLREQHHTTCGWMEKMNTGKKWDRRYFLATDKGLHYYENDQPSKKAKGSWYFSHDTVVQENVTEEAIVGSDKSKHYFALVLKRPDFVLYCRVGTAQEKTRWITFLRTALERFYYSIVGEDPNMYRWGPRFQELHKLRISFLKEHAQSLQSCLSVEDEVRKLEDECKEIQKEIEELSKEEDLIDCELHQWEDTATKLRSALQTAEERHAELLLHNDVEEREAMRAETQDKIEKANAWRLDVEHLVRKMQHDLQEAYVDRVVQSAKTKDLFEKWRFAEQLTPLRNRSRSLGDTPGLPFPQLKRTMWYM